MFMFKIGFAIHLSIIYCSEADEMQEYENKNVVPMRGQPIKKTVYTRNDLIRFPYFELNSEEEETFIRNFNDNYNVRGEDRNIIEEPTERNIIEEVTERATKKIEVVTPLPAEETDPRLYNKPRGSVEKIWGDAECITRACRWYAFGYLNSSNTSSTNQTGIGDINSFNQLYNEVSNLSGLNLAGFVSFLTLFFGVIGFIIKMCWKFRKPIKSFYDIVTFKNWRTPNELNNPQPATNPSVYTNPAFLSEVSGIHGPTAPPTNSEFNSGIQQCPSTSCMKSYPSTCELATIALPQYANIPCIPKSSLAYTTVAICPDNVVSPVAYSNLIQLQTPVPENKNIQIGNQELRGRSKFVQGNNNGNDSTGK